MTKKVTICCFAATILALVFGVAIQPAHAIKPFSDEFKGKYVKEDSKEKKDQDFAKLVGETKCNVCHLGKSKKDRNPYGVELSKLLDKKADKANKDKIQSVLAKVEKLPVNAKDKKSPTFGELIKAGKLPGGKPVEKKDTAS
jgi:hypothetical protein